MSKYDPNSANLRFSYAAEFDPEVKRYSHWDGMSNILMPWEYTNWQEETKSWKENCYLAAALTDSQTIDRVKGPDAEKLLSYICVNNFSLEKFPVGRAKHAIICTPLGTISAHGVVVRVAEDEFETHGLQPDILAYVNSGQFDVEPIRPDYEEDFVYQLAGPKSLEVLENALKKDIHDVKFMQFIDTDMNGIPVKVLRMGMGGTLAYEVHCSGKDRYDVYETLWEEGQKYGIHKLGHLAYMCNHTENGFPQCCLHFNCDWENNPVIASFDDGVEEGDSPDYGLLPAEIKLYGSMASEGTMAYYLNPIEAGWGKMIYWDHEFIGKEALQKIAARKDNYKVVTLEWNPKDVLKIFENYLTEGEDLTTFMEFPKNYDLNQFGNYSTTVDKVVNEEGKLVGKSTGRVYTIYYRKVISMGFVLPEYANEGTEITIIWGDTDKKQIPIRAKVARYPYLDLAGNRDFDMESIPRYKDNDEK